MSERKVLNKYYPPDYDASKIPRVKRDKYRQFTIRLMVPFNIRCKTCGEYIYRGKKFNARKEDVVGSMYLGIQIYRFYIKCTKCLAEITFLTDPANSDYAMENGAIRNFESVRLAEKQAEQEAQAKRDEEENNPMKVLENRTRDSRREMAILETLEDLRELNAQHATVDTRTLIETDEEYQRELERLQQEEDEEEVRRILKRTDRDLLEANIGEADEIVVDTKDLSKTNGRTINKVSSSLVDDDEPTNKKIKMEENTPRVSTSILFPKPSNALKPQQPAPPKKTNVASFIRKKQPETTASTSGNNTTVATSTPLQTTCSITPTPTLGGLLSAYGDTDSDSDD